MKFTIRAFTRDIGKWRLFFAWVPHHCPACERCFWLEAGYRRWTDQGTWLNECADCHSTWASRE